MSGIFDVYKPTDAAPSNPSLVGRLMRVFRRDRSGAAEHGKTTEAGTSATASPSVEQFELWQWRYDRRAIVTDVHKLMLDDPRVSKAAWKYAREATRKGVIATVKVGAKRGPAATRARRAQEVLNRTLKDCHITPLRLRSWAFALIKEGDLFVQRVVAGDRVVDAKRMPAISMERNTDSQDRYFDVMKAFTQIDVQTDQAIADFAAWQIHHERWNHVDGDRYGTSAFVQLRRPARNLQLMEQAQVIRRITRAALRLLHKVGTRENPGTLKEVEDYKAANNLSAQSKGGFDPSVAMRDYFGNGATDIQSIPGDPNLEKIDDLEYFQDLFAVGTGAPKAMLGWSAKDINRDILKDQIEQWLKEVQDLTDAIANVVRGILDLALLLEGIDPDTVEYHLTFSTNTTETAEERQSRVSKARQNTLGSGKNATPDPLIPKRVAVAAIAEDYGFTDVDAILSELDEEEAARRVADEEASADDPAPEDDGKVTRLEPRRSQQDDDAGEPDGRRSAKGG